MCKTGYTPTNQGRYHCTVKKFRHRLSLALLIGIALASGWLGVAEPGRAAVKAALFVPEILPSSPVRPQAWLVGRPTHTRVMIPLATGEAEADLYLPAASGQHPAVVLFLGVVPAGRDDPRVTDLANALARSNIVVLIPWSDVMLNSRRLDTNAVDLLIEAYRFLQGHKSVKPERIGLAGFCVGASFATLAAQDERIRDSVAYVNSFGGYFDGRDMMVSIVSRTRLYQGVEEPWEPRDDTREVFTVHLIEGLADPLEREALANVFLEGNAGPGVDPNILPNTLSDTGRTVYRLLSGVSRTEAETLVDSLPPSFTRTIEAISPSTSIAALKAPVLIMHDREDSAVPASESRKLAEALAQRGSVYYTEFSLFQHVDPTRPLPPLTMAREVWKLLLHMYNIMRLSA